MSTPTRASANRYRTPPAVRTDNLEPELAAYDYLSMAAHQSRNRDPASPESHFNQRTNPRRPSLSPIRRISKNPLTSGVAHSEPTSDEEANLVVVENPDGSLLEGMPSGFKHVTPLPSPPRTPRGLNFAATGLELVELYHKHERVFLGLLLITIFADSILLTEELATMIGAVIAMRRDSGSIEWGTKLGAVIPSLNQVQADNINLAAAHARQTFSVFPPTWSLGSALSVTCVDVLVCLVFFVSGFMAYVSKQRKSYAWFGTIACAALVWQVILSCVDKLSLILFLSRLATFTHARFMGDLMDDIALLATLITGRPSHEEEPVRPAADASLVYDSTS